MCYSLFKQMMQPMLLYVYGYDRHWTAIYQNDFVLFGPLELQDQIHIFFDDFILMWRLRSK